MIAGHRNVGALRRIVHAYWRGVRGVPEGALDIQGALAANSPPPSPVLSMFFVMCRRISGSPLTAQSDICWHRCPLWLFCLKNWHWFAWWFNHLPSMPSISPEGTPMYVGPCLGFCQFPAAHCAAALQPKFAICTKAERTKLFASDLVSFYACMPNKPTMEGNTKANKGEVICVWVKNTQHGAMANGNKAKACGLYPGGD